MSSEQDMRKMGALWHKIPTTAKTMLVGTLAISGAPLLSGFFSKDEILWQSFSSPYGNKLLWVVGVVTAAMTAFYMFRLFFLTFAGNSRVPHEVEHHIHESPAAMTVPLICLAVGAVGAGWVGWPKVLGGANWFEKFLEPVFENPSARPALDHTWNLEFGLIGSVPLVRQTARNCRSRGGRGGRHLQSSAPQVLHRRNLRRPVREPRQGPGQRAGRV
jgi:NADH:ubiquinone oxidoreductase subunit 5 (subunit L)/multisubunit Na+/H+ antiporter MnhA subunit